MFVESHDVCFTDRHDRPGGLIEDARREHRVGRGVVDGDSARSEPIRRYGMPSAASSESSGSRHAVRITFVSVCQQADAISANPPVKAWGVHQCPFR